MFSSLSVCLSSSVTLSLCIFLLRTLPLTLFDDASTLTGRRLHQIGYNTADSPSVCGVKSLTIPVEGAAVVSAMQVARRLRFPSEKATATTFLIPKRDVSMTAIVGVSHLLRALNFHRRGRSFAASVPSEVPKVRKVQKRVSKDERKALVESYVSKYREMNGGKFPTVSNAKNQVGGSYYLVKKILQEIEYTFKISSMNLRNENVAELRKSSTSVRELSSQELTIDEEVEKHYQKAEAKKVPESTTSFDGILPSETVDPKTTDDSSRGVPKQMVNQKAEGVLHQSPRKPQQSMEGKSLSEDVLGLDGPNAEVVQCQRRVTSVEDNKRSDAAEPSHELKGKAGEVLYPFSGKQEQDMEVKAPSEAVLDQDGLHKVIQHQHEQIPHRDKSEKDLSDKRSDEDHVHSEKSSIWGNLKSLVGVVVNMWSKR